MVQFPTSTARSLQPRATNRIPLVRQQFHKASFNEPAECFGSAPLPRPRICDIHAPFSYRNQPSGMDGQGARSG